MLVCPDPAPVLFHSNNNHQAEQDMLRYLESVEQNTILTRIHSLDDIKLKPKTAKTAAGYRLCQRALSSLCKRMGISTMSNHLIRLADGSCDTKSKNFLGSVSTAISIFNFLLDTRGSVLRGAKTLVSLQTKTIEGILGATTRMISRVLWMSSISEAMASKHLKFWEGSDTGLKTFTSYIQHDPVFRSPECYMGYSLYFMPTVSVGHKSVMRISPFLLFPGIGQCRGKSTNVLPMLARNNELDITDPGRLKALITSGIYTLDPIETESRLTALSNTTLPISLVIKRLSININHIGLPTKSIKRICARLMASGKQDINLLDACFLLINEAATLPIEQRLDAERSIYSYFDVNSSLWIS